MSRDTFWLALGFVAALLLIGVPFWNVPYAQANLPDSLIGPGLFVLAAVAVLLALAGIGRLRVLLATMALCPAVAVALRVVAEGVADPTSHNLWPIEIVIALVLGAGAVLPALVAGSVARWLGRRAA
jgi:hypothetical protein